jgi:hypothetical protein
LFHRKHKNAGAIANFNTRIERDRGHLVHILHGDDLVEPTLYRDIERHNSYPNLVLYACRNFVVDESGGIDCLTPRCPPLEAPTREIVSPCYENALVTPAVVVRRRFYETHDGFSPALCHVADWEMWLRCDLARRRHSAQPTARTISIFPRK